MKKKYAGLFFALVILAALFPACADNDNGGNNSCVPNGNIACPMIYGPVCVQNRQGAFCNEGNQCIAGAKCEQVLCSLDLDLNTGGSIDPNSECAKSHPECLNPCP